DVGNIGSGKQYQGFNAFEKTGTSTWTLTGTTGAGTPWTLKKGTLSIASEDALGAQSSALTFDGGTLQNTKAFTLARRVTLDGAGGTFDTGADLSVSGVISGTGALTQAGTGTLTLTGTNTYTGETAING